MGSQLNTQLAYIAGFLDGDGSLMLQIKKRSGSKRGVRFMATVCFYQDKRHAAPLASFKDILEIGYLSNRNDGMTELRINGFKQVHTLLQKLIPYIQFKKKQAAALYRATGLLKEKTIRQLTEKELLYFGDLIIAIRQDNYSSKRAVRKEELLRMFNLTP